MSSHSSQDVNSDFLIFNPEDTKFPSEHSMNPTIENNLMQLEEVDHLKSEQGLGGSDELESSFCTIVNMERSWNLEYQSERDNHFKNSSMDPKEDVVDSLLAGLQRARTPNPPSRASSEGSSLEPLSEAFEVPASLSPPSIIKELPSHRVSPSCSYTSSKRMADSEFAQASRPTSMVYTQNQFARSHKRAKSETPSTVNSPTEERKQWEVNINGTPRHYSHFHLGNTCDPRVPISVPPSPRRAPISLSSPLIADVNVAKSRVLVTKTHCFYPERSALIPFSSCLLGFQLVFHSSDPKARIKHSEIKLTTSPIDGGSPEDAPIIKAIHPSQGMIHKSGDQTLVRRVDENSIGIKLGVDPYGAMIVSHTQSRTQESYTSPYLLGSGIETNKLLITMNEDSSLHSGVPPSLAFALLLYLPSKTTKAFQAELTIETSVRNEIGASLRKIWASPKVWKINYDGKTELGSLEIH